MERQSHQQLTTGFINSILGSSKPQRYFDRRGDGLHLLVSALPEGASLERLRNPPKSWVIRCNVEGIRFERGLGAFPNVGLSDARAKARHIQSELAKGCNPFKEADDRKRHAREKRAEINTRREQLTPFHQVVFQYYQIHYPTWTEKHAQVWISMFRNHVFGPLGDRPVNEISTVELGGLLAPLVISKPDTAKRLRQRIEAVFEWAIVSGLYKGLNPARLSRLKHVLPKHRRPVRHRGALAWQKAPQFWKDLAKHDCVSALSLRFLILTCTRSGETRGATWNEIDFDEALWIIPAERMKAREAHRVPLSKQAIHTLRICQKHNSAVIFPSDRTRADGSEFLGENALTSFLRKSMNRTDFTPHGFRSTFRDWASEVGDISREVAEKSLAHKVGDAVERAYARSDLLDRRRNAMQYWANFLEGA